MRIISSVLSPFRIDVCAPPEIAVELFCVLYGRGVGDDTTSLIFIIIVRNRRIFQGMTVQENLEMGAYVTKPDRIQHNLEYVYEQFPRLKERTKQIAGTLSGGEQQMLAMGRALMSDPKLLMLDEPSMGLAPILVDQIFEIIENLNKAGTTILLVEQNAQMALSVADRAYVIETGRITLSGTGEELAQSDQVKKAYLGG